MRLLKVNVNVLIHYQYAVFSVHVPLHLMEIQHLEFENISYFNIFLFLLYLVNFLFFSVLVSCFLMQITITYEGIE